MCPILERLMGRFLSAVFGPKVPPTTGEVVVIPPPPPSPIDFTFTGVTPAAVSTVGGEVLNLSGSAFVNGLVTGTLNGTPLPLTFVSSLLLQATMPAVAAGTVTIVLTQSGSVQSKTLTATAPVAPATTVIAVAANRLIAGSGTTVVSVGFPFPPTFVPTAADLADVALWLDLGAGLVEVPIYIEPVGNAVFNDRLYHDGSLRSALIQASLTLTAGTPVTGELRLGVARATTDRTKVALSTMTGFASPMTSAQRNAVNTVASGYADGVVLPTDTAYLLGCRILEDTITVTESRALGGEFNKYENLFAGSPAPGQAVPKTINGILNPSYDEAQWSWFYTAVVPLTSDAVVGRNYYDRANIYYAWWLRTGTVEYYRRACILAYTYRELYVKASGYTSTPWNWMPEGIASHYLLSGDPIDKVALENVATLWATNSAWHTNYGRFDNYGGEARPMARIWITYLHCRRLGFTSRDYTALLLDCLNKSLGVGVNGTPAYGALSTYPGAWAWDASGAGEPPATGGQYVSNFMQALLCDAFIKHREWYGDDTRILPAIKTCLIDYLWNTQWNLSPHSFPFHTPGVAGNAVDLNGDFIHCYSYIGRELAQPSYTAIAETILATLNLTPHDGATGPYLSLGNTAIKQFIEQFFHSWKHLGYRIARRSYP